MSDIEGYVVDYISSEQLHGNKENDIMIQQISNEMDNPKNPVSLQDLIEMLEPSLTSTHDKERNRATMLLAELIAARKNAAGGTDSINPIVIHLFVVFFCRRLSDYPSLSPSLYALNTLFSQYSSVFDPKYCDVLDIIQTLTKDIHVPSYAQNIRQRVFELFDMILRDSISISSLQGNNVQVVDGIVNSMEDEKDPRCLLVVMKVILKMAKAFTSALDFPPVTATDDYRTLAEKIFDNISCYFPISFTPPPDDPFGITPEDLSKALEDAMCSVLPIVKHSVPFFVEQINNDMPSARVHALKGLISIVEQHRHLVLRGKAADLLPQQPTSSTLLSSTYYNQHHGHDHSHGHYDDEDEMHQSYLLRLSNLLFDIALTEGSQQLVDLCYQLVGCITYSISIDLMPSNKKGNEENKQELCGDWRTFHDNILRKAEREFGVGNIESLRSKLAWKLCMVIGTSGGCLVSGRIVKQLYRLVMDRVKLTSLNLRTVLVKTVNASKRNMRLLSTSALVMNNNEKILPASLSMLESLLCCALPLTINISQLKELNPLSFEEQSDLIKLLISFMDYVALEDDVLMEVEVDDSGEKALMKLDGDSCAALTQAIHAMKTYLMRTKGFVAGRSLLEAVESENTQSIIRYLHRITNIICHGIEYIFYPVQDANDIDSNQFTSWAQGLHLNIEEENVIIRSACSELLIQLVDIPGGQRVLHTEILPKIISLLISSSSFGIQDRLGKFLSEIAIKSSSVETFELIVNALIDPILKWLNDSSTLEHCQRLLGIIVNCFPKESKGGATDKSSQNKAVYLAGVKSSKDVSILLESPLLKFISAFARLSIDVTSVGERTFCTMLMSLVATTIFYLQQAEDQDALLKAVLEAFPSIGEFFFDIPKNGISNKDDFVIEFLVTMLMNMDKRCSVFASTISGTIAKNLMNKWTNGNYAGSQTICHHVSRSLAIVINKLQDNDVVDSILLELIQILHRKFSNNNSDLLSGVELLVSVVKGLVLRPILPCKHSLTQFGIDASTNSTNWQGVFLDLFLSLLFTNNNRSLAAACANQLTLLLQDPSPYEILSKTTSRGNYALFWQQKLFSLIFPSLQSQVRALMGKGATNGSNVTVSNPAAILLSVGKIIKGVSLALLKSNFDDFVESIIFVFSYVNVNESSNNDDFVIVDGEAISALQLLLKEKPVAFVDHLNIIIPRLIKIAQRAPQAKIRATALECLDDFPQQIAYSKLHPHRKNVINGLMSVLDDRKRAVRQLASKVRNDWILFE